MKRTPIMLPKAMKLHAHLGERIKLARLRRKLSTAQVAERGISRKEIEMMEPAFYH